MSDRKDTNTEARLSALEADFAEYRREHRIEHVRLKREEVERYTELHAKIDDVRDKTGKAIGDFAEQLGHAARDLGGKADALTAQSARIELSATKISLQGAFLARVGLLVIFGAAIGGGMIQGGLWWLARQTTTEHPSK